MRLSRRGEAGCALAIVLATGTGARAQAGPASPAEDFLNERGPRASLMLVGSFHFTYPDRDVVKARTRIDVLDPRRQRELDDLGERLARYAPTRIAVERSPNAQAELDSQYREYAAGRLELPRGEEYQIGFRLARRLGLERVHAVDTERAQVLLDLAAGQIEPHEAELLATDREWRERFERLRAHEEALAARQDRTLVEMFAAMNTPEAIRRSHLVYHVGFFKFDGEPGGYAGADFVSGWYNRNLRIFRNLQRLTRGPDERLLLVIGSGHLPILRFVAQHSPEYRLLDANSYLETPAGAPLPKPR